MLKKARPLVSIVALFALLPGYCQAYHEPLWELGIGIGTLDTPHYRGSKSRTAITLPLPYGVYRGEVIRADSEEGITGKLFQSDRIKLDLSLAGNLPVPDSDEGVRSGMPELDLLLEAGPELTYRFWESAGKAVAFSAVLPLRLVFSVGDSIDHQGLTFSPYVNLEIKLRRPTSLMRFDFSLGPIYADSKYHDYFYAVAPEFVTADRMSYEAESGYGGNRITLGVSGSSKRYLFVVMTT